MRQLLKNSIFYSFLVSCLLSLSLIHAKEISFQLKRATITIDVHDEWTPFFDQYGIPFTLVGPQAGTGRPTLMITPTGWKNMWFTPETVIKDYDRYKDGRRSWVRKMKGKIVDFHKYRVQSWDGVLISHKFGFDYSLNGKTFRENSYYVICKDKQLYHFKTLLDSEQYKPYEGQLDKMVKSFTCKS